MRIALPVVAALALALPLRAQRASRDSAAVVALELEMARLLAEGRVDEYAAHLAPDYARTTQQGRLERREAALAAWRARGPGRGAFRRPADLWVRVYGDAAVLTGVVPGADSAAPGTRITKTFVRRRGRWLLAALHGSALPPDTAASARRLMAPQELLALPSRAPDRRIAYGADSLQYGDLRVPAGAGPHPVVVLVHGGCFKSTYADLRDLASMADALKDEGIATWNVEYRRVGHPGGGWPGTYLDVGRAVDHLRALAGGHALDLGRVVVVGHSAGGHLALWAAGRARLPARSPLHAADPLPVRGVVDLAGPLDMTANVAGYEALCRDRVITSLFGGPPAAVPERYAQASPIRLLPLGVPQVLVWGEHEDFVPRPLAEAYVRAATQAGDAVRLVVVPGVGHFEIASPRASPWPRVLAAVRSLLDGRLPPAGGGTGP